MYQEEAAQPLVQSEAIRAFKHGTIACLFWVYDAFLLVPVIKTPDLSSSNTSESL